VMELISMALRMASFIRLLTSPRVVALFLVPLDTGTPGGVVSTSGDGTSTPGAAAPAHVAACVHKSDIPGVASLLSAACRWLPTPGSRAFLVASFSLYLMAACLKISANLLSNEVALVLTWTGGGLVLSA
jgi:hypothetical protein